MSDLKAEELSLEELAEITGGVRLLGDEIVTCQKCGASGPRKKFAKIGGKILCKNCMFDPKRLEEARRLIKEKTTAC